jgi:putative cell wall-binding protein
MVRVNGPERTATAVALSERAFPDGAGVVYIARSDLFPDALVGGPLAARDGGPVLLVHPDRIPAPTTAEIVRLAPERLVVLGGAAAVSDEVVAMLEQQTGVAAARLPGGDRYGTAALASASAYPDGADTVFVVTGQNFPDALAAGAAAARIDAPVLLATRDGIPAVTAAELVRLAPGRIIVVGGSAAVGPEVEAALAAHAQVVERIARADRYATAAAIAERFFPETGGEAFVATGASFADALTAAPAMGQVGAPLLLTSPIELPASARTELCRRAPDRITIVGGVGAVSQDVMATVGGCLGR